MKGLDNAVKNLNLALSKIKDATEKGMLDAARFVEGEAIELTPVDFGILQNSTFAQVATSGDTITARVGYAAKYAPWVHELPMKLRGVPRTTGSKKGRYWDGGENKFLEKAIKYNINEIVDIIATQAKKVAK